MKRNDICGKKEMIYIYMEDDRCYNVYKHVNILNKYKRINEKA